MAILVTGATGNIGRRVVDHLIELGAKDIRALIRNPRKADLPDGVTAITGYLGAPESLPAAFDGVERIYLAPLPATLDTTLEMVKSAKGIDRPQQANALVAELTGTPAESVAQWAARNVELFA